MKKLFAMAAFAAAMCFGACTENKTTDDGLNFEKSKPEQVVSNLVDKVKAGDAATVKTAIETVQTQLSKLVGEGNVSKLAEYAPKIQAFIEENQDKLKGFGIDVTSLTNVFDQVKNLTGDAGKAAEGVVDDAEDAVEGAVEGAVGDAADAVQGAVGDAVDAVQGAANDAVEAGKAAVEEGKAKANEAIQNAADQIKL